jgi:hypothetical protein
MHMRTTILAIALGLVPAMGFAADGAGSGPASSTAQLQPINTIDPVTGLAVDPSIPAVVVQDIASAGATRGSSAGIGGTDQAAQDTAQAAQQQVAIGVSDRSSAALIQANPEKYVQAARQNLRADDLQGSQSGSSMDDGSGAAVQNGDQSNDNTGLSGQEQPADAGARQPGSSTGGAQGTGSPDQAQPSPGSQEPGSSRTF